MNASTTAAAEHQSAKGTRAGRGLDDDCGCGGTGRSVRQRSTGCGCGGSCGGSCGGGCGCGGHTGAAAFVRPRFFSGMLLTEDDLQAIDDYTVEKRRLTNRHLFGTGVVCGLEVDCDPCRPGWLTVTPGYALDCCGNDIVVGCPEELDALVLLDELRRRSGVDCGEPCDEQPPRDYLLVVRYDERAEQPVAPYSQDDCAVGDCEYSRVREGYRFELACDVEGSEPSLFDRLAECLRRGDDRTREEVAVLSRLLRVATTQARVSAAEAAEATPVVEAPTAQDFDAVEHELKAHEAGDLAVEPALDLLSRSTAALTADAAHAAGEGPRIFTGRQRDVVSRRRARLAEAVKEAPELEQLHPEERQRAMRILGQVGQDPQELASLGVAERMWSLEGMDAAAAPAAYVADAESVRSRLLHEMERRGRGNCLEREEIKKLPLDRLDAYSRSSAEKLARSYLSMVAGCLCDLANPPCPSCTELRVPLARVRIEDCRVVDVCNLVRQWLLAPRSLNYWVPILETVRALLMRRCCDDRRPVREVPTTEKEMAYLRETGEHAMAMVRSPVDAPELRPLVRMLDQVMEPFGLDQPERVRSRAPAAPAPAATPPAAAAADPVTALEARLAELGDELKKLKHDPGTAGRGGGAGVTS